jgi:hypothetical protein
VQVAGLSYSGDVRQGLAENPRKVRRRMHPCSRAQVHSQPQAQAQPQAQPQPQPQAQAQAPNPAPIPQVNDIVGAQLSLLREIYAAPLAESRVERAGATATATATATAVEEEAAAAAAGQVAGAGRPGEASSAVRMYLHTSLEARQQLVRPLPPPPFLPMCTARCPTPCAPP